MVFFGMVIMSDAMRPLRSYEPFLDDMLRLDNVLLAALVGAGFTALVQSSSATTGILIVMASEGLIGLEPAVALALGANVGTCVTALLASIGKPRAAVRIALVHTIFNVAGVLIWIGFVDELAMLARGFAEAVAGPSGSAGLPRQLANIHTFFNVANALLFLGFTGQLARFVEWLLPDRAEPEAGALAQHLDPAFLGVPAIALDAARREVGHLGQLVRALLDRAMPALITGSPLDVDRLRVMDRPVDLLHREIVAYLRQLGAARLPDQDSAQLIRLIQIANDLEHVGDLVATGLVTSARKRMEEEVIISPATHRVITGLHLQLLTALDGTLKALEAQDAEPAREVRQMKNQFQQFEDEAATHQIFRLRADAPRRLHTYTREIELIETFDDIFRILRRIARTEIALFTKPT
jgi:phosphate:Na+ symporter